MKKQQMWSQKITKALLVIATFVAGVFAIVATNIPIIDPVDRFFLAFKAGTAIHVRWSRDGIDWQNGDFPAGATAVYPLFRGTGAAADGRGVEHIVGFDAPNSIHFVWGLGPTIWDNFGQVTGSAPPRSAISMAYWSGNYWLVSFLRKDGTISVNLYDHRDKRFIADFAPQGGLNSRVIGRPAITTKNGKAVVAWRRFERTNVTSLVVSVGEAAEFSIRFSEPIRVDLPSSGFQPGITSDPDVAHAGDGFVLAAVREQVGGGAGTLHGWRTVVLRSVDGENWQPQSANPSLRVHNQSFVNIAGASDGSLLIAALRDSSGGDSVRSFARFSDGQWVTLDAGSVFGRAATYAQFALINKAQP